MKKFLVLLLLTGSLFSSNLVIAASANYVAQDLITADYDDEWDEDWEDDWGDDDWDDNGFYDDEDWGDEDEWDDWDDEPDAAPRRAAKPAPKPGQPNIQITQPTQAQKDAQQAVEEETKKIAEEKKEPTLEEKIQADLEAAQNEKKYNKLAKSLKRSKEEFEKLYSQYGDLLAGLNPSNPKDLAEIEKLIEIVGVPKTKKSKKKPTFRKAPLDDPLVNFSARSIPVRDAFATLARVSGKSITVSGQVQERDIISVVEINDQPFSQAFLSLAEAADVDFSVAGDNYTVLKRRGQKKSRLNSSLAATDIDLDLPLDERYADLIFDNEDLSSIIKELANLYGVDVVMTANPTERVTIRVRGVSIEDAFELVFSGSQFSYTRKDDTFVVYSSANKNFSLDKKTVFFPLKYLEAQEANKLMPAELKNLVQVSENQNAFIAEGSKAELTQLYDFIRTIDKPIPQVELNVKLVEVAKDFLRDNTFIRDRFRVGRLGNPVSKGVDSAGASLGTVFRGISGDFGKDQLGIFRKNPSFQQNTTNSQIKVNQRLLVTSGKSAKINFDEDINVVLNASDSQNTGVVQNQRIQRITAGNSMDITPVVGGGGVVTVKVEVEVSVNGPINSSGIPQNTVRRRISSEIQIGNHETIAIGGLFDDRKGNARTNEIPLLSRIPIIGHLFANNTKNKNLKELLILITPHIRTGEEEEEVFIQARGVN